jgi:hypothetical protein
MVEYDKGGGRRLLVGYTDDRAKKDAYNREKGIRRLEKAYKHGALTKGNINKRGYNKFLSMDGEVKVAINYAVIVVESEYQPAERIAASAPLHNGIVGAEEHLTRHVLGFYNLSGAALTHEVVVTVEIGMVAYMMHNARLYDALRDYPLGVEIHSLYLAGGAPIMSVKIDSQDKRFDLNLPKGIYIIKVGKIARKIVIK